MLKEVFAFIIIGVLENGRIPSVTERLLQVMENSYTKVLGRHTVSTWF